MFPSEQHRRDEITSFRVKAGAQDAVLLAPSSRALRLGHGKGWSGQASWWFADDTSNRDAIALVDQVKALLRRQGAPNGGGGQKRGGHPPRGKGRAGAASASAYQRYVAEYEAVVNPRHHKLEKRFKAFLIKRYPGIVFSDCFRDDLRYTMRGETAVMVEIKPSETATVRFAIRTAIGQLLDYRQHQCWTGRQLILVETPVTNADDLSLASINGFGIAWPDGKSSFQIHWPPRP